MPEDSASIQDKTKQIQSTITQLCRLWNVEEIRDEIVVEFSGRLTRSLGRTHSSRKLIRLNKELRTTQIGYLDVVVCHELAHVVAVHQHGPSIRPHGKEWQSLMQQAGYEPSVRLKVHGQASVRNVQKKYRHYCPVCHLERISRARIYRWRCLECVANGLSGELQIEEIS